MGQSVTRVLADEAATEGFARELAHALAPELRAHPVLVLLAGDLGAGKTALARGVLRALGHQGRVPSPTYTLVEPYRLPGGDPVWHLDLYRLSDPQELEFLGWSDFTAGAGLVLVEWPERAPELTQQADLHIEIDHAGEGRRITVRGLTLVGDAIVRRLPGCLQDGHE